MQQIKEIQWFNHDSTNQWILQSKWLRAFQIITQKQEFLQTWGLSSKMETAMSIFICCKSKWPIFYQINEKSDFWGYLLPILVIFFWTEFCHNNYSSLRHNSAWALNTAKFQKNNTLISGKVLDTNKNARLEGQTDASSEDLFVTSIAIVLEILPNIKLCVWKTQKRNSLQILDTSEIILPTENQLWLLNRFFKPGAWSIFMNLTWSKWHS